MTEIRRPLESGFNLRLLAMITVLMASHGWAQNSQPTARVIEILADHDSRYKMEGQKQPVITAKAGEQIILRISAKKAKNLNRDGSIHGFSLLRAKDRKPVPDWDFLLKPGIQEFAVLAPSEPGEYIVVCTVICSQDHEGMNMKFVVTP
jgi:heme/copper-type cytochrome/quinol oxidase subunit 2